jgi:two-component system sensor histidine kinase YesM
VLKYDGNDEFKYLYSQINALVTKHNKLIKNYYEERYRSQMNELIFLQSQIKPHFFYNSLYLLQNILRLDDVDNGLKIVKYLSNYFAFLAKSSADTITLDDELAHMRNYVEIQKFRYMERINVEFGKIPDEYRKVRVPRLILQPIIENCFKHGLSEKVSEGIINVDFTTDRQVITISIRDNGKGFEEQQVGYLRDVFRGQREPDEVTGLINVNRRLVLKYGPESGLRISNNESGGSKVDVIILKEEQEDVQADDRG